MMSYLTEFLGEGLGFCCNLMLNSVDPDEVAYNFILKLCNVGP